MISFINACAILTIRLVCIILSHTIRFVFFVLCSEFYFAIKIATFSLATKQGDGMALMKPIMSYSQIFLKNKIHLLI